MIGAHTGFRVFAVEDTSVQIDWNAVPLGRFTITSPQTSQDLEIDDSCGATDVVGLTPDTRYEFLIRGPEGFEQQLNARTLPAPRGEEMCRFATMSDLHLGAHFFGRPVRYYEPDADEVHPDRCAASALLGLQSWGASHLFIKGDLVDSSRQEAWDRVRRVFSNVTIPVDAVPGNHEVSKKGSIPPEEGARTAGVPMHFEPTAVDLNGLRVILSNSTLATRDRGAFRHMAEQTVELAAAARTVDLPVMLLVHHQPQRFRVPTHIPLGVSGPAARHFTKAISAANPAMIASSGHTHRHRRHSVAGIPWTETGSPKDYPGTWTGYVVHEGGIRQVVRRVSTPSEVQWLDRTHTVALGTWGHWSIGRLSARCFTHPWPAR